MLLIGAETLMGGIVAATLDAMPHVCLSVSSSSPDAARAASSMLQPDVIICAGTPGSPPVLLLAELRVRCPSSGLVVVCERISAEECAMLVEIGAASFLVWGDLDSTSLSPCLTVAIHGETLIATRSAAATILDRSSATRANARAPALSGRERVVLDRLAEGLTREQIAVSERLSLRTVERTIASLETKLQASSPFMLGVRAVQLGCIP